MTYVTVIGLVAAACTTIAFIPQIYQVYRTRHTRDLALPTFIIFAIGIFLWLIYGILLGSLPVILANTATLVMCIYVIIMKIRCG